MTKVLHLATIHVFVCNLFSSSSSIPLENHRPLKPQTVGFNRRSLLVELLIMAVTATRNYTWSQWLFLSFTTSFPSGRIWQLYKKHYPTKSFSFKGDKKVNKLWIIIIICSSCSHDMGVSNNVIINHSPLFTDGSVKANTNFE